MNITIQQDTTRQEQVSFKIIEALYKAALSSDSINISGNVKASFIYRSTYDYLNNKSRFPNFYLTADEFYLEFKDNAVKQVLMLRTGSEEGITEKQAASITSFGSGSSSWFYNNTEITEFPELKYFGLTELGSNCFLGCTNLKVIDFSNITKITGSDCFKDCGAEELFFPNLQSMSGNKIFNRCKVKYIRDLGFITNIPNAVSGEGLFATSSTLLEVNLPDTLTSIGSRAFFNCSNLKTITANNYLSNTLTINYLAFASCNNLTFGVLYIPLVTYMNYHCFSGNTIDQLYLPNVSSCYNLTYWANYNSFTSIFNGSSTRPLTINILYLKSLSDLYPASFVYSNIGKIVINRQIPLTLHNYYDGSREYSDEEATFGRSKKEVFLRDHTNALISSLIYVPDSSVNAYKTAEGWTLMADKIRPISELSIKPKEEWDLLSQSEKNNTLIEEFM